jgi:hypothetical protein
MPARAAADLLRAGLSPQPAGEPRVPHTTQVPASGHFRNEPWCAPHGPTTHLLCMPSNPLDIPISA